MEIQTKPRRRKWLDFHLAPPFQWTLAMILLGIALWFTIQLAGYAVDSYFGQRQTNECGPTNTVTRTHN